MNRRRLIAAVFFSVVIVAVLALIVFTEAINSSATVHVMRLKRNVGVGQVMDPNQDFDIVPITAHDNDFNFQDPNNLPAPKVRYTLGMHNGDIIRPDDLEDANKRVEVPITATAPPPVQAGDSIDIIAIEGTKPVPIGHGIPVETASGNQLTILVPAAEELDWVAVASSQTALHIVRSASAGPAGTSPAAGPPSDLNAAIQALCKCTVNEAPPSPNP